MGGGWFGNFDSFFSHVLEHIQQVTTSNQINLTLYRISSIGFITVFQSSKFDEFGIAFIYQCLSYNRFLVTHTRMNTLFFCLFEMRDWFNKYIFFYICYSLLNALDMQSSDSNLKWCYIFIYSPEKDFSFFPFKKYINWKGFQLNAKTYYSSFAVWFDLAVCRESSQGHRPWGKRKGCRSKREDSSHREAPLSP